MKVLFCCGCTSKLDRLPKKNTSPRSRLPGLKAVLSYDSRAEVGRKSVRGADSRTEKGGMRAEPKRRVRFFRSPAGVGGWPGVLRVGFLKRIEALRSVFCPTKGLALGAPGLTRTSNLLPLKKINECALFAHTE